MKIVDASIRSLGIIRCSFQVIGRNKKLAIFPALTAFFTLFVVLFFLAPTALLPTGHSWAEAAHWSAVVKRLPFYEAFAQASTAHGKAALREVAASIPLPSYVYLVGIFFGAMTAATFINVASYHEILKALAGEGVSLRRGLRFACTKLQAIVLWVLLAGTIGIALHLVAERFGWLGRYVIRLVGLAWSVASMFVIPVMIRSETRNPFELVRDSAAILKKTWGESVVGWIGLRAGAFVVMLGWCLLLGIALVLSAITHAGAVFGIAFVLGTLALFAFAYLNTVANSVFQCAVYVYATEGEVPSPFGVAQIDGAWRIRS